MTNIRRIAMVIVAPLLLEVLPAAAQNVALTAANSLTATNSGCTATACLAVPVVSGSNGVAWQLTGTFTGTVTFEVSVDGVNYVAAAVVPVGATRTLATTATAAGVWQQNVTGYAYARARCSAYTSGTIVVTARRSAGTPPAQ